MPSTEQKLARRTAASERLHRPTDKNREADLKPLAALWQVTVPLHPGVGVQVESELAAALALLHVAPETDLLRSKSTWIHQCWDFSRRKCTDFQSSTGAAIPLPVCTKRTV